VAATGVKFWPGSPSTLDEKVTSGFVSRFGTFDYISDNLACFKDGFGDSGSFFDVSGHRFYVAKPFLEEVTDVLDPLCDVGSSCRESSNLGAMVEVMARARCLNTFFHRSRTLHSKSRTPRTSSSWTCVHNSTTSSTPSKSQRPWNRRASSSSARCLRMKTPNAA
jgi:hypothetical protein